MFKKCLIVASMIPMMCFGETIDVGLKRDEFIINVSSVKTIHPKTLIIVEQKDFLLGRNSESGVQYRLISCFRQFANKEFKCTKSTDIQ